jgi:hypothetical protein
MTSKIAEYFPVSANTNYVIARILRQSKANEYIIIDRKVGDEHRSYARNPFAHALERRLSFG